MLKRALLSAVLLCCSLWAAAAPPKLVVVVIIDQFRYDYLTRFKSEYHGGLDRLWKTGAVFTNAHLQHFPTVTAVGHATFLTGAIPSLSGIVGNEWFDRETGRRITSVFDSKVTLLGAAKGDGASPGRLLVSSIGDELKSSGTGTPRVIGISLKDRAAILPAGRMADGAYWFDNASGNFVSSTYYFPELPAWMREFNGQHPADRYAGAEWKSPAGKLFKTLPSAVGPQYYDAVERSPFGTELVLALTMRAIQAEGLGSRNATDLVSVSLSSTDLVGHAFGPDSAEIRDMNLQTDRLLGQFFEYLDARFRPGEVLLVFTADHGVAPLPKVLAERRMPGGWITEAALRKVADAALRTKFGDGNWVLYAANGSFWLNRSLIRQKMLKESNVEDGLAEALADVPHVSRAYSGWRLETGQVLPDRVGLRVLNGYNPDRSADVITVLDPYWVYGAGEAGHGSPYSYDTHVPLIFMGPGIKPGRYDRSVAINDIAPTLATILEIETPSGSIGRVLDEMLEGR